MMKAVVNAGELKDSLIVLGITNDGALDENGFPVESTHELFKLRCKKKSVSTKEFISADREITQLTYKFICRKRNIDNDMLIEYKGKRFDIKHVHEFDDGFFIEITASEKE